MVKKYVKAVGWLVLAMLVMYLIAAMNGYFEKVVGKFIAMCVLAPIFEELFKVTFGYTPLGLFAGVLFGVIECGLYLIQGAYWWSAIMSIFFHTATALIYWGIRQYEFNKFSKYMIILLFEMMAIHGVYNLLTLSACYIDIVNGQLVVATNYFSLYSAKCIPIVGFFASSWFAYKIYNL